MGDVGRIALQRAWQDLEWRFGECEAALGFHGMGFEGGCSKPWDESREDQAHRARHRPEHRRDVNRLRRVDAILAKLPAKLLKVLVCACTPVQLPWQDDLHGQHLREAFKREGTHLLTLAVVLDGPEVREAWGERYLKSEAEVWLVPSRNDLLRFLEGEAHYGVTKNRRGKSVTKAANAALLRRLHHAAERRIRDALLAYALENRMQADQRKSYLERLEDGHAA
jgi:hypothetical protein